MHTLDVDPAEAEDDDGEPLLLRTGCSISADTDFGALLASAQRTSPSVVLFHTRRLPRARQQAASLVEHLNALKEDLLAGAVVVVADDRI